MSDIVMIIQIWMHQLLRGQHKCVFKMDLKIIEETFEVCKLLVVMLVMVFSDISIYGCK